MTTKCGYFYRTFWGVVLFSCAFAQIKEYKWQEGVKEQDLHLKSQFCQARCLAKCKDVGFLKDCPHKCEVFAGGKWLQECGKSAECVSTCNHLTNATGKAPSAPLTPRLQMSGVHSVDISWSAEGKDVANSSLIFVIEYGAGSSGTWGILAKTWQQHYEAHNLDVCTTYHYRIAAVNEYGQSAYSRVVSRTEMALLKGSQQNRWPYSRVVSRTDALLPRPGPIHGPTYTTKPYYDSTRNVGQVGYFKAVITWKPPIGWNETTDILKYSQPTSSKICNSTNHNSVIGIPLPLVNYQSGSNNVLEIRVLSKAFGCRFEFKIHAVTRCGKKGQEGSFVLDLSDCKSIDNYHPCPTPMGSIDPGRVNNVTPVPINNTLDVEVSWSPPTNLGTSRYLLEYRLRWGLVIKMAFVPTLLKPAENETSVLANTTKTIITVKNWGVEYGVQIIAIGTDSKPVKWGLLTVTKFMVLEPILNVRKDEDDKEAVKSTTAKVTLTPTQSRFIVTLNTTEHQGSPYISDVDVMPGELKEIDPYTKTDASHDGDNNRNDNIVVYISIPICVMVVVIVGIIYGIRRQRKFFHLEQQGSAFAESYNLYNQVRIVEESPPPSPSRPIPFTDKWEIPYGLLYLQDELGEGAFGHVYMATLRFCDLQNDGASLLPFAKDLSSGGCPEMTVAVKKLHEYADKCQKQEFLREIHLMKTLGSHPNVVNMIGCCTIEEPLCLLVEHMPNGDLLHYLRKHRSAMQGDDTVDGDSYYEEDKLKYQDLLSFARQIAKGMEFLSQKGFVHRDLASRNILVGENRMVKVSDFGLTRYVYDDKVYVNRKGGKLPLKWMSIEAIFDLTFSTASDVWAFGVVLFEIITLGGTPYPTISNKDLLRELKMGYRMEKPENCDDELYYMMLDCWSQNPHDRPDFTDLKLHLEQMIESLCKTDYLDIDNLLAYYNAPITEDDTGTNVGDDFEDIFGAGISDVDLEVLENHWEGSTVRLASGEEDLSPSCSSHDNLVIRRTSPSTSGNSSGRESMEAKDDNIDSPSDLSDLSDGQDNPCPLVLCVNHDSGHVSYDIELDSGPESDLYLSQRKSLSDSKDDIPLWDDVGV